MRRRRRATVSAVLAGLALLATLPALCACMPETAATDEHSCCAPPDGLRAAGAACCAAATEVTTDPATTPSADPAVTPALAAVASWVAPSASRLSGPRTATPVSTASPPLTVRRL